MLAKRIIPCLDVKKRRVVKGVPFVSLRDADDPVEVAESYDAAGADEITFLDITAFAPLIVGGGVKSERDVEALLDAGADKIAIEHIYEGLSECAADGALCASIFHDGTFTVADVKTYLAKRGLTVRPAPRTLQSREMS